MNRPERIAQTNELLAERYGSPSHFNRRNPLDELLFIVLSTLTHESNYLTTFRSLKSAFPTATLLADATEADIAQAIAFGGLSRRKAQGIHGILRAIVERFDRPSLAPLRALDDQECERFLTSLPLVGLKTARCVMMYSLDREVFPVDTHCWRIARRLGWVRPTRRDGSCSPRDMDRLQDAIPPAIRHSLHVNLIAHGRVTCVARKPLCSACPISSLCPQLTAGKR